MEGVEDIPEVVMANGLPWTWESFPQYLDEVARRPRDIDIGIYLPHSPLRVYVMGARGARREAATAEDLAHMRELTREAMHAGAFGFATSRLNIHRTGQGEFIPSHDAAAVELEAIAKAVSHTHAGILQLVLNLQPDTYEAELDLVLRLAQASGRPVSFSLAQQHGMPDIWRRVLAMLDTANQQPGVSISAQVFPRPIGMLVGHQSSVNPFSVCPAYAPLAKLPLAQRIEALRQPEVRSRLLRDTPADPRNPLYLLARNFEDMYPLGTTPTYEPAADSSVAALARASGRTPEEVAYDLLLEDDGKVLLYLALANYKDRSLDAVLEMMRHPHTVLGLGDGGAHFGLICDSSYPTSLLSYWTRGRSGAQLTLPEAVRALTASPAATVGLHDRGSLQIGRKADLNVIDYDNLALHRPNIVADLPGGGRRLMQQAEGYSATIVAGKVVYRDGVSTGDLPGQLVRGAAYIQASQR
jgi:N-acyl-D-aspartate/D-glutamate deacylase